MNHGRLRLIALLLTLLSLNAQAVEEVIHYHNDALGSPIAATDQDGALAERIAATHRLASRVNMHQARVAHHGRVQSLRRGDPG